jgi:uncharacterized membrane protein YadS
MEIIHPHKKMGSIDQQLLAVLLGIVVGFELTSAECKHYIDYQQSRV